MYFLNRWRSADGQHLCRTGYQVFHDWPQKLCHDRVLNGARAGAMNYSLVETVKANQLNTYQYFKLLLTEIPKHINDKDLNSLDNSFSDHQMFRINTPVIIRNLQFSRFKSMSKSTYALQKCIILTIRNTFSSIFCVGKAPS